MKTKISIFLLIAGLFSLPMLVSSPYLLHMAILICLGIAMSTAWSLSTCCGFSFGHSAYYGCGAYATLILLSTYGVNPLIGALAGVAVAVVLAATTGGLIFRLKSHYFALGSIAIGEIVRNVVNNIPSVTNGAEGINAPALEPLIIARNVIYDFWMQDIIGLYYVSNKTAGINAPALEPLKLAGRTITDFTGKEPFFYLALTLAVIVLAVSYVLQNSKMGYYFRAIQEDQDAACSLGISLTRYKTLALCLSAGLMSLSGSLYAVYIRFIEPGTVMSLDISIETILMSILGGVAIFGGSAIGAIILIPLSEVLRSNLIGETLVKIGMITEGGTAEKVFSNLAHAHVLIYGILVVLIILYAPQGVLGFVKDKFKRSNP